MIVLNEHEWAENMIKTRDIGKKPYETLCRVAKYYADMDGMSKKKVREALDDFLLSCIPSASIPKWEKTLDYAVARAYKYDAIQIDYICITEPEMEKIDALEGKQIRRLAFTLLCLAKYWDIVNPNINHWVCSQDSDIMRMANIGTSIKRQSLLYYMLRQKGMIHFSKRVDNTNVQVKFIEEGEPVMKIYDFRNLGYQYLMFHGEPYFVCSCCGITTKIKSPNKGRKQQFCAECAAKRKVMQSVNSVMRQRKRAVS